MLRILRSLSFTISMTLFALNEVGKPYVPANITHWTGQLPTMMFLVTFIPWVLGYIAGRE